ncbi:MAG: hypothetical protein ACTSVI_09185 [Promethearchaeota archaeon]
MLAVIEDNITGKIFIAPRLHDNEKEYLFKEIFSQLVNYREL